jgi:hypothetical protein
MTSYTKATDFAAKDTLSTGNPAKLVKGTEIDDEFNLIEAAINSKANTAAPTFTGTVVGVSLTLSSNLTVGGSYTGTIDGGTY